VSGSLISTSTATEAEVSLSLVIHGCCEAEEQPSVRRLTAGHIYGFLESFQNNIRHASALLTKRFIQCPANQSDLNLRWERSSNLKEPNRQALNAQRPKLTIFQHPIRTRLTSDQKPNTNQTVNQATSKTNQRTRPKLASIPHPIKPG
jgi:hypothetical protein